MWLLPISLVVIIPVILILWLGDLYVTKGADNQAVRRRVGFILALACVLLAIVAYFADGFVDGDINVVVLVLLPLLEGILALLIVQWRMIIQVWRENKLIVSFFLLVLLLLLFSFLRYGEPIILFVFAPAVILSFVWLVSKHLRLAVLEIVGVLLALLMLLEAVGLLAWPTMLSNAVYKSVYQVGSFLLTVLSLFLLAVLVHRGNLELKSASPSSRRVWLGVLLLLLITLGTVQFRHAILAKATGRAAEDHMPGVELVVAVMTGMVLIAVSQRANRRWGYAYLLLVPILLLGSYAAGWLVEPIAITDGRAQRLTGAIDQYYGTHGSYPADLGELSPQFLPVILGPLTGRGQVWCYQAGGDYYRLGYVFFERYHQETFPTPFYEIRVFSSAGESPSGEWMCDRELEKHKLTLGL